jgi:predicted phosphodiesterase
VKLHILSDLHLSTGALAPPPTDADIVILAGDITRPREAVAWAQGFAKPVLYVLGNHEFYGGSIDGTREEMRRLCADSNVHLLDASEIVMGNVRFLGATLWTDFNLFDDAEANRKTKLEARHLVRDFSRIKMQQSAEAAFTPEDSSALFAQHAAWLDQRLRVAHPGPTVVITHHAPTRHSIHPRFEGSPLNPCFVSDAQHLMDGTRVQLWIHGHTHDSFDYVVNGTRVVCNPRGYAKNGVIENARFDPNFIIEVSA